jgi:acetyl esterase/lipase
MLWLLLIALLVWGITFFYLRGEDLSRYDAPRPEPIGRDKAPSDAHREVVASFAEMPDFSSQGRRDRLRSLRGYLDDMGRDVEFNGVIQPVDVPGVRGEWMIPAGADLGRRMLYIHGGAFMVGSPLSHRAITSRYAEMLGGPVLALDYRLMPEHPRRAGIDDCRLAYRWLLSNSPSGQSSARELLISGDSAGGNLTLSLLPWIRDLRLQAPAAAIALSPVTDVTFSSPSMRHNVATDYMLGPQFGKLNRVPRWLSLWVSWINGRARPSDPDLSPVYADLGGLPPTLVQASASEMLLDDAVRWVNKANAGGSPATLQLWAEMVHVWHIFVREMPEAQQAFAAIADFIEAHSQRDRGDQAA